MDAATSLKKLLLSVLDKKHYLATEHVVEALRVEYPQQFHNLMDIYAGEHNLSGCGLHMGPLTAVSHALEALAVNSLVEKVIDNGVLMWRLASER